MRCRHGVPSATDHYGHAAKSQKPYGDLRQGADRTKLHEPHKLSVQQIVARCLRGNTEKPAACGAPANFVFGGFAHAAHLQMQAQRDAGRTLDLIASQLAGSVPEGATAQNTVIAYEPVWAIGTGRTPTNDQIAEVHALMRDRLAARFGDGADMALLYGGSVKPGNAAEIFAIPHVNGALVGGASLKAADFGPIVAALSAA